MLTFTQARRRSCQERGCKRAHAGPRGIAGERLVWMCEPCLIARFGTTNGLDIGCQLMGDPPLPRNRRRLAALALHGIDLAPPSTQMEGTP